jgi:hypothetical protein
VANGWGLSGGCRVSGREAGFATPPSILYVHSGFGRNDGVFLFVRLVCVWAETHPTTSKEYGREPCPGWVVIKSGAHQRHRLDYSQTVRETPAQKGAVP